MKLILIIIVVLFFSRDSIHITYRESFPLRESTVIIKTSGAELLNYTIDSDTIDVVISNSECYKVSYTGMMLGNVFIEDKVIALKSCQYLPLVVK